MMRDENSSALAVVDLFCGAGGLSHGFFKEGLPVAYGIDSDASCRFPYEKNNKANFICKDVDKIDPTSLSELFGQANYRILVGCTPCQPFSAYNHKNDNPDWRLLGSFGRLIKEILPDVVSMENVPRLLKFREGKVFENFVTTLKECDYHVAYDVLYGPDFGLPQTRSRLVLMASRIGQIGLPKPTHENKHRTVRDAIGKLPHIQAGEANERDPMHRSSTLSEINVKRIRSSRPGGTWHDWGEKLVARCHTKETGKTYSSVYGRMTWDKPSPTITTQFYGFGNGRFGHPEQDRALSLREGAILQGFPRGYKFFSKRNPVPFGKVGQMIGNAVPVPIGRAIARAVKEHIRGLEDVGIRS